MEKELYTITIIKNDDNYTGINQYDDIIIEDISEENLNFILDVLRNNNIISDTKILYSFNLNKELMIGNIQILDKDIDILSNMILPTNVIDEILFFYKK